MNRQIKLTEIHKETFGILYYCIKNAIEVCDTMMLDKSLDGYFRHNFIRLWIVSLSKIKTVLDKGLGINDGFDNQIKKTDTQGLYNVITGYIALSPEGREAVENLFDALKNNEEIKVEVA